MTQGPAGDQLDGIPRTSAVILDLALAHRGPAVALGEIIDGLRERSFGLVFILLAVGNLVPLPPGVSGLLGFGIAGFALQLLFGGSRLWLPQMVRRRTIQRDRLVGLMRRAAPLVRRLEAICRPRLASLTGRRVERLLGVPMLLVGLLIAQPLPLTGAPPAIAALLMALGLLERDGLAVVAGLVAALVALLLVGAAAGAYAAGLAALAGSLVDGW